jgi:hypothetical protein
MWEFCPPRIRLRGEPRLEGQNALRLRRDFEKFRDGLPRPLEPYILETYGLNLASVYGGLPVKNPFGKASGQLSLARHQIEKDAEAGLGFVVLKTAIARNAAGEQSMHEWAIPETRMLVEPVRGRSGAQGWTVTWKGRGWYDTFEAYLELFSDGLALGADSQMLIVPSVKYHLPTPEEEFWNEDEYRFTTNALVETWGRRRHGDAMPLEKDFSPTLAGSDRARQQEKILEWLRQVPGLVHRAAPGKVSAGLKIFNTLFEDAFQLRLLEAIHSPPHGDDRADFFVYANRLFDPSKTFEGKTGVAYGGPDLSDRNLAVLENFQEVKARSRRSLEPLPLSATGDILTGRMAAEYLLRGASTFQMHTLFQLPDGEFAMKGGNKTERALHHFLFHPLEGFIAWSLDLRQRFGWKCDATVEEMAGWCRENWNVVAPAFVPSSAGSVSY